MPYKDKEFAKEYHRQYSKRTNLELKKEVFSYYSGGTPCCACCGESHLEFLTIDHMNGDGAVHRKQIHCRNINYWLRKNNYPGGFRILCFNCNWAFGHFGYCPHVKKDGEYSWQ